MRGRVEHFREKLPYVTRIESRYEIRSIQAYYTSFRCKLSMLMKYPKLYREKNNQVSHQVNTLITSDDWF